MCYAFTYIGIILSILPQQYASALLKNLPKDTLSESVLRKSKSCTGFMNLWLVLPTCFYEVFKIRSQSMKRFLIHFVKFNFMKSLSHGNNNESELIFNSPGLRGEENSSQGEARKLMMGPTIKTRARWKNTARSFQIILCSAGKCSVYFFGVVCV